MLQTEEAFSFCVHLSWEQVNANKVDPILCVPVAQGTK